MRIESNLTGFKELEQALKNVAGEVSAKALRGALRAGGDIVKRAIESNIAANFDSDTGQLAESIRVKSTLNKKQSHNIYDAAVYVGVYNVRAIQAAAGKDIPASVIAYWLESGVKPHDLNAKSKRSRGKVGEGENNFHPGIAPKPFIRPALLNNEDAALNATRVDLKARIERAVRKATRG